MCLWFACFGLHKHDDDHFAPSPPVMGGGGAKTTLHDRPTQHNGGYHQYGHPQHQQGAHYGNGVYRASPHRTTAAGDEAGRKASSDARAAPAHAAVAKDAAFAYTAPAAAGTTLKPQQPAWNGRVAEGGAGHGAAHAQAQQHHYHNYYEREPVHREAAAVDHHHYYSTADHERY